MTVKAKKQLLSIDMRALEEDYFQESSFIGISSALPLHRLCHIINNYFDINISRHPESDIHVKTKHKSEIGSFYLDVYFPVFCYCSPCGNTQHYIYSIKKDGVDLFKNIKHLDYLWLLQGANHLAEADYYLQHLKNIAQIQLTLNVDKYKIGDLSALLQ